MNRNSENEQQCDEPVRAVHAACVSLVTHINKECETTEVPVLHERWQEMSS